MTKKILIDFEKIKDPFSGLGQFCSHLKIYFDKSPLPLYYFIPNKFEKLAKKFSLLLPSCSIFHATHQDSPYIPWSSKTKYILTIHDLNALYEHTQFGTGKHYKKILQKKINRASAITFISEFTRDEVLKNFTIDINKTQVIYNGISLVNKSSVPSVIPRSPFIFAVGTVLPKKNFHVLIDLLKLLPEYNIVLAGTTFHAYANEIQKRIKDENLLERFHMVGTINEEEKRWYYEHACAFIFPSLLEGFGLPVAEAMSLGLPLFLSDKTSLPEIGGNDAFYFKNFNPIDMKHIFINGLKSFNQEQKNRLIERSKKFNWEKAAKEYLDLYQSLGS